jgi:hypothetical protein
LRLSSDLVSELDAKAEAEGTTRKVIITRALKAAGYHVPAHDLEDRTPRRRWADLDWQRYFPAQHDNEPCLYMWLYIPFNFAPRYVGETASFLSRHDTHGKNFRDCKYTVLLPSFFMGAPSRTHRDFVLRWHQVGALPSHVFVPGAQAGQTINPADSLRHWSDDLLPLVCPLLSSSPHDRHVLETRVRMDVEAYYAGLASGQTINWGVHPRWPQSRLFGRDQVKRIPSAVPPSAVYRFEGGPPFASADDFFAFLGTGALP